ncbi:MAG: hypothetical protein EZS28_031520, partial [Streblomastix strix]
IKDIEKEPETKVCGYGWSSVGQQDELDSESDHEIDDTNINDQYSPSLDPDAKYEIELNEESLQIIVVDQIKLHPSILVIYQGLYNEVPIEDAISFVGDYQFITEKRYYYGSKMDLLKLFQQLIPFVPITKSSFYRKTKEIIRPKNRTDLCSFCHGAEQILNRMKRDRLKFIDLTQIEKEYLTLWKLHNDEAQHQRYCMSQDLFNLQPNSCVVIADFKENIHIDMSTEQESQEFYHQQPITCLSFVVHVQTGDNKRLKRVYTIISKCLNHTSQFVVKAFKEVLKQPEFKEVKNLIWYSDGAGHFKSTEILAFLQNKACPPLPGCHVDLNYFSPSHGKSECDSVFGFFSKIIAKSLPKDGIHSMEELVHFLQQETQVKSTYMQSQRTQYRFNCTRLAKKVRKMEVKGFKNSLHFTICDGMLVSSRLSHPSKELMQLQPISFKLEEVSSKSKQSTAPKSVTDIYLDILKQKIDITTH